MSQSTLSNVKRKVGRQRNSESTIKIFQTKSRLPASIVNQIIKKIHIDYPPTQHAIAKSLNLGSLTLSRMRDLFFEKSEKHKILQCRTS